MGVVTSPIAYPGAKTRVTSQILDILPTGIKDWREPFFGGGSVSLAFIQSKKAKDCERFVVGTFTKRFIISGNPVRGMLRNLGNW